MTSVTATAVLQFCQWLTRTASVVQLSLKRTITLQSVEVWRCAVWKILCTDV